MTKRGLEVGSLREAEAIRLLTRSVREGIAIFSNSGWDLERR